MAQRVVCLIPARNATEDLPGCLESAARFCDVVVALDDGSTDATRAVLEAHSLVQRVLTNPPRVDYRAWDDAENRNRLLEAAWAFEPDWIVSLDADERIDAADAAALRTFLETDALPGCAYGFKHVAMRGDAEHCLPRTQWIYRLFGAMPGQRFPDRKLHFIPIPTSIPRTLWFQTTIRVQHFGSATAERRMARFEKYAEADPNLDYQADYGHLLHNPSPSELIRWRPRPPELPVLLEGAGPSQETREQDAVAISAIVIARDNASTIAISVASVVSQECPEPFETIVVVSGSPATARVVREGFPSVTLIEMPEPALPGAARNAGLAVATGEFVSFPGSHIELPPGSLAARLAAHRRGYAMVTGIAVNGTTTRAGWASYFLDHHEGLPGSGPSVIDGAPAHCSYARLPLLAAGGFPEDRRTGEDTAVNRRLVERGYIAVRDPAIQFTHRSPCRTPRKLIQHHFVRGRGWGQLQIDGHRRDGHLINRALVQDRLIDHLPRRLARIETTVAEADADLAAHYRASKSLIRAGAASAWAGMWFEILRPRTGKLAILVDVPVRVYAIIEPGADAKILIVEIDRVDAFVRRAAIPLTMRSTSLHGDDRSLGVALGLAHKPVGLPQMTDLLQNALDLDLDGIIVTRDAALPLERSAITSTSLAERNLLDALERLRAFSLDSWVDLGVTDDDHRDALRSWTGAATAYDPELWLP